MAERMVRRADAFWRRMMLGAVLLGIASCVGAKTFDSSFLTLMDVDHLQATKQISMLFYDSTDERPAHEDACRPSHQVRGWFEGHSDNTTSQGIYITIDMAHPWSAAHIAKYHVEQAPTLLIFAQGGQEVARHTCFLSLEDFRQVIERHEHNARVKTYKRKRAAQQRRKDQQEVTRRRRRTGGQGGGSSGAEPHFSATT